mmetsp:Transcript_95398/g.270031  ORF Transcript_95398/g.270031 Transcript_95398/m.270031 type:complete len:262 (-) Transcript_95398:1279-2064(-)
MRRPCAPQPGARRRGRARPEEPPQLGAAVADGAPAGHRGRRARGGAPEGLVLGQASAYLGPRPDPGGGAHGLPAFPRPREGARPLDRAPRLRPREPREPPRGAPHARQPPRRRRRRQLQEVHRQLRRGARGGVPGPLRHGFPKEVRGRDQGGGPLRRQLDGAGEDVAVAAAGLGRLPGQDGEGVRRLVPHDRRLQEARPAPGQASAGALRAHGNRDGLHGVHNQSLRAPARSVWAGDAFADVPPLSHGGVPPHFGVAWDIG